MGFTVNSFFCGAGGMDLGFIEAGFTVVGAWDFDKYAVQTYKENVGDHVLQMDITEMTWKDVPKADVWTFGFPCQDLSLAGKRNLMKVNCLACGEEYTVEGVGAKCPSCGCSKFKAANRSGLFFEVMRLLDETSVNCPDNLPKFIMAENVKGLKPYLEVLHDEYERRGYTMNYTLFNSKYWGVPQNRERYFVVGTRSDLDVSFSFPDEQHAFIPKLSSILDEKVEDKYYISDEKAKAIIAQALKKLEALGHVHPTITPDRIEKRQNGRRAKGDEEPMFTLTAQDLHGVIIDDMYANREARVYDEASPTLRSERTGLKVVEGKVAVVGNIGNTGHHGEDVYDIDGVSPTVKARDYKGPIKVLEPMMDGPQKLAGMFDDEKGTHQAGSVWNKNGVSPTLDTAQGGWRQPLVIEEVFVVPEATATGYAVAEVGDSVNIDYINSETRRGRVGKQLAQTVMTGSPQHTVVPREGGDSELKYRVRKLTPLEYGKLQGFPMSAWKQVVSNTQAYKQFGNAVTVNVAKAIATAIKEILSRLT